MIPVNRPLAPSALNRNADSWLTKLQQTLSNPPSTEAEETEIRKWKAQIKKCQNKYQHKEIKTALETMFCGKCCYCESKVTDVAYGDIEHFYPKSRYPDKTFMWENLLFSCQICNEGYKGDKFPLDADGNPLLIDPSDGVTNPNQHLDFVWDNVADQSFIYGLDEKGKTVEEMFDFNGNKGRIDLVKNRNSYLKKLMTLFSFAQEGNQTAIALLKEACQQEGEYSAFARIYIQPYLPS